MPIYTRTNGDTWNHEVIHASGKVTQLAWKARSKPGYLPNFQSMRRTGSASCPFGPGDSGHESSGQLDTLKVRAVAGSPPPATRLTLSFRQAWRRRDIQCGMWASGTKEPPGRRCILRREWIKVHLSESKRMGQDQRERWLWVEHSIPRPNCPVPCGRTAATAWVSKNKMKHKRAISQKGWVAPCGHEGILAAWLPAPQQRELAPKWRYWRELHHWWHLERAGHRVPGPLRQLSVGMRSSINAIKRKQQPHPLGHPWASLAVDDAFLGYQLSCCF